MKLIARYEEETLPVEVERFGAGYRVKLGDRVVVAELITAHAYMKSLQLEDGTQYLIVHHRNGNTHEVSFSDRTIQLDLVDPLSMKRRRIEEEMDGSGAVVTAIMPGRVVRVLVAPGDEVKKGAGLLILEAMKMENEITASRDGVVATIHVQTGQAVESGDTLITIG